MTHHAAFSNANFNSREKTDENVKPTTDTIVEDQESYDNRKLKDFAKEADIDVPDSIKDKPYTMATDLTDPNKAANSGSSMTYTTSGKLTKRHVDNIATGKFLKIGGNPVKIPVAIKNEGSFAHQCADESDCEFLNYHLSVSKEVTITGDIITIRNSDIQGEDIFLSGSRLVCKDTTLEAQHIYLSPSLYGGSLEEGCHLKGELLELNNSYEF